MSKTLQEVYVVAAKRSAVGKARGMFRHTRPDDLLAEVLNGTMASVPSLKKAQVDDVIIGCAMPEGEQGMNVARMALLLADFPETVPGVTVNRFCSSGIQTIAMAADRIATGQAEVMIAGGTESMTMIPMGGHHYVGNPAFFANNEQHVAMAYGMGLTAECVAEEWGINREQQDTFALESHRRALAAIEAGEFNDEILPITVRQDLPNLQSQKIMHKSEDVKQDQGPRAGSSLERLAKLPTVFKANGTVTAANTSQMSDGAAAVVLVSEKTLRDLKLAPLARYINFEVAGVSPKFMGIGPRAAIPKALDSAGLSLEQIDWVELNEAFAAQTLAVMKDLRLDPAKVNPLGGAIALGHPLGATGAIRTATLIHGLRRHKLRYGMVTMCIGTGMGAAGIFEAM